MQMSSREQPIVSAEQLIDIVIGQPVEVYDNFMEALKQTKRADILAIIINDGLTGRLRCTVVR